MHQRYALGVMLKAPVPGRVKTRLVPPLTDDEAAGLYRAFLIDIFERLSTLEHIDVHAFYSPAEEEDRVAAIVPQGIPLITQKGSDFGERIYNAFDHLLTLEAHEKAAVIGTDSPDLPVDYIVEAYSKLDELRGGRGGEGAEGAKVGKGGRGGLVLGPTTDGGYYLVAMDEISRVPFEGIPWSTDRVLASTWKKARHAGMGVRLLKLWYDVDKFEDLALVTDIKKSPETCRFIAEKKLLSKFSEPRP